MRLQPQEERKTAAGGGGRVWWGLGGAGAGGWVILQGQDAVRSEGIKDQKLADSSNPSQYDIFPEKFEKFCGFFCVPFTQKTNFTQSL